jgi:hypothetical protein
MIRLQLSLGVSQGHLEATADSTISTIWRYIRGDRPQPLFEEWLNTDPALERLFGKDLHPTSYPQRLS